MIGRAIGNYVVQSRIGEGGQGIVYLAEHPRIGRRVAIKVLRADFGGDAQASARLFGEARSASAIRNEHIIDVIDFGELEDGAPYVVMEWLEGRTLDAVLASEAPLATERAIHIALGAGEALDAAHAHGIIHRDLKPSNLFLVSRSEDAEFVKVLDFGVAKFVGDEPAERSPTQSGAIVGTPIYMAPEQMRGRKRDLGPHCDQYALAVILYEMLTGKLPFSSSGLGELLLEKMTREPAPLRDHVATLPEDLDRAVLRALARNAEHRFSDVGAFLDALHPFAPAGAQGSLPSVRLAQRRAARTVEAAIAAAPRPAITTLGGAATESIALQSSTARRSARPLFAIISATALLVTLAALLRAILPANERPLLTANERPVLTAATSTARRPPEPTPTVRVELHTVPAAAAVTLEGAPLANPFSGAFPRSDVARRLEVRAAGYRADSRWIAFDRDHDLEIRLVPVKRPSRPAAVGAPADTASRGLITDLPERE